MRYDRFFSGGLLTLARERALRAPRYGRGGSLDRALLKTFISGLRSGQQLELRSGFHSQSRDRCFCFNISFYRQRISCLHVLLYTSNAFQMTNGVALIFPKL